MLKRKRMVHIEVCTGLRRSQDKKMVVSKVKCGKRPQDILVIGEITAKRVSASNSIKMEINTKECGQWIKNMDKVLIGDKKIQS